MIKNHEIKTIQKVQNLIHNFACFEEQEEFISKGTLSQILDFQENYRDRLNLFQLIEETALEHKIFIYEKPEYYKKGGKIRKIHLDLIDNIILKIETNKYRVKTLKKFIKIIIEKESRYISNLAKIGRRAYSESVFYLDPILVDFNVEVIRCDQLGLYKSLIGQKKNKKAILNFDIVS